MYDLLVTPIDEHNDSIVILIKKYKFNKVIVLVNDNCKDILKENIIRVSNENNSEVEFIKSKIDDVSLLNKLKEKYNNILLNLTGGERIQSLNLLNFSINNKIESIYIDILGKKKYIFGKNNEKVNEHLLDLNIEDMIKASGNEILEDSSDLIKERYILDIAKIIYENIELWNKYKKRLYDINIFSHFYGDTKKVVINQKLLEKDEIELLEKILKWAVNKKLIEVKREFDKTIVSFKDKYLKGFIFKIGTWLEVLTEYVVKSIDVVDQVKSGVVFTWNKNDENLKNELDVVAIKDSNIVVISCKDSEKYNEIALNELKVYSERIGGDKSKKILVATKPPIKESIMDRAKEMGINIIILDKDLNKFKEDLEKAINN
ncbi:Card1-like endonuclease domain-containing protein [Clostridium thermobutyricum]